MALTAGTRLGPYAITTQIGQGGMGEVYKARDTRLDRTVAIKILPQTLAADPEFRNRFDGEARAISRLDHPHICALYDVGEHAGTAFLVMQYLEGETLADRLAHGALPIAQALKIAIEIASALDAAHSVGIVHRDLKPGNVMLTKAGAKLVDFGLAKTHVPVVAGSDTMAATAATITASGMILGTFQYMAPEQIEGREADARTDLFAFGCVLFEMLTGRKAFEGKTPPSVIGAILKDEPPTVSTLQAMTPPLLDKIVRRCLAKNPGERWCTAGDLAVVLTYVAEGPEVVSSISARADAKPTWLKSSIVVAGVAAIAVLTGFAIANWRAPTATSLPQPIHLVLSEQVPDSMLPLRSFAISPDGMKIVYLATSTAAPQLHLRDLRSVQSTPLAGTENATQPFFAPDGKRIGFVASGKLQVLSLAGGAPAPLADVVASTAWRGATWAPDDTIIYSPATDAGLWQVPATGGTPRVLAVPDSAKGERSFRWPELLPGGDAVMFTIAMSDILSFDDARIVVRSLRTGAQQEVVRGGSFGTYVSSGHVLYARAGTLLALPFDLTQLRVTGTPTPILNGVVTYPITGAAQYVVSANGTLLYLAGKSESRQAELRWVARTGQTTKLAVPAAAYQGLSISPDGGRVALDIDGANSNTWILDLDRPPMTRLTMEWSNNGPTWTPDGTRVAFTSARGGLRSLFWQRVDDPSGPEPLFASGQFTALVVNTSWLPDGRTVIFDALSERSGFDLWVAQMDGDRVPKPLLEQTSFNESHPAVAPDGRSLAYVSNESGRQEVYVQPYPGPGRKYRVSADGGTQPVWAPDGRELFYRNGDAMMSVMISPGPGLSARDPLVLFRTPSTFRYGIGRDGRFLMIENLPPPNASRPVSMVLNYFEELRERLPTK